MVKLLCDARGAFRENFMNKMIELSCGEIELGCHLGYENADYNGTSLQWLNTKFGKSGNIVGKRKLSSNSLSFLLGDQYQQILETTVEQLYRTSPDYSYQIPQHQTCSGLSRLFSYRCRSCIANH